MDESRYNCSVHRPKGCGNRSRRGSKNVTPRSSLTTGEGSPCKATPEPHNRYYHNGQGYYADCNNHRTATNDYRAANKESYGFERDILAEGESQGIGYRNQCNTESVLHRRPGLKGHDMDFDLLTPGTTHNDLRHDVKHDLCNDWHNDVCRDLHNDVQHDLHQSIDKYPCNNNSHHKASTWQQMPVTVIGSSGGAGIGEIIGGGGTTLEDEEEDDEPVWQRRESVLRREKQALVKKSQERAESTLIPKQSTSRFKSFRRKSKNKAKN